MSQADSTNTTGASIAGGGGALYIPIAVTPEEAFQAIGRLRKEARNEINRLIQFLDETDNHMEREQDGDELDASFPESGSRLCTPGEDDELSGDETEPSLGSGSTSEWSPQSQWATQGGTDDMEDEHDGAEPEDEGGETVREDDEPSLGWPERMDQTTGAGSQSGDDRELQNHMPVRPQHRTEIDRTPLTVEVSYRRFLSGLTPDQRKAMQDRRHPDSGVSLVGGPAWGEQ